MGLDIAVYSKIEHIEESYGDIDDFEDKYPFDSDAGAYKDANGESVTYIYPGYFDDDNPFLAQMEGLKPGAYTYEDEMHFRAGSYGGYNRWREWLSFTMLGVSPSLVWSNPDIYKDKPFYHLIYFSDCEGVIGAKVCKQLAQEFADGEPDAISAEREDEWFIQMYAKWQEAFELASDDGFVDFH